MVAIFGMLFLIIVELCIFVALSVVLLCGSYAPLFVHVFQNSEGTWERDYSSVFALVCLLSDWCLH